MDACAIYLIDKESGPLQLKTSMGFPDKYEPMKLKTHLKDGSITLLDLDQKKFKQMLINLFYNSLGKLLNVQTYLDRVCPKTKNDHSTNLRYRWRHPLGNI